MSAPSGRGWISGLCRFPGGGDWCLCSGGLDWTLFSCGQVHVHLCVCGVCELIMILGSLSGNGWGCVPVLLVVWHGASITGACWPFGGAGS